LTLICSATIGGLGLLFEPVMEHPCIGLTAAVIHMPVISTSAVCCNSLFRSPRFL